MNPQALTWAFSVLGIQFHLRMEELQCRPWSNNKYHHDCLFSSPGVQLPAASGWFRPCREEAHRSNKSMAFTVVVLTGTFQLVVPYVGSIYSRYSSSQPQIPKIHFIAYFTSADACLGDEFENYCFIKSISSLEEAYVSGRICIDRSLTLTSRQCLPPSLSSPQLDTRSPKFWVPSSWPGCLRECMQMVTAHHEHFAQRWARRVRRPSSCFDWGSSFVLEVSQLMRDCSGDKDTTTQNEPKKKPIFTMVWFLQLLLYPVEINFRMTCWSNTLRILTESDSVLLFLHADLIPLVFLITLPFPQTSGVLTSPVPLGPDL